MKFHLLIIFTLFLISCAPSWRHSWLIVDHQSNECFYLHSSDIRIDDRVRWYNFHSQYVSTSEFFDLRVIDNEQDYQLAVESLNISFKQCKNGLNK